MSVASSLDSVSIALLVIGTFVTVTFCDQILQNGLFLYAVISVHHHPMDTAIA